MPFTSILTCEWSNWSTNLRQERTITVDSGGSILVPVHEALHSYLPGMWTRRSTPQKRHSRFWPKKQPLWAIQGFYRTLIQRTSRIQVRNGRIKITPPPPGQRGDLGVHSAPRNPCEAHVQDRKLVTACDSDEILDYDEGAPTGVGTQNDSECRVLSPSDGYMSVHSPDKRFIPTPNANNASTPGSNHSLR